MWRNCDINAARLDQVYVGSSVDQCHDLVRAKSFREHGTQDVGFLGVCQGTEHVDVIDVLLEQQLLVGGITHEHNRLVELFRNVPRPLRVSLDYLDLVGLLERERQPHANISATGDDDAANRVFETAHLAHEDANVLAISDEEDFVTLLDDRVSLRQHGLALPVNRGDSPLGIRHMFLKRCNALADQQAITISFHADEAHTTVSKIENLRRPGIQDELLNVLTHQLFGADTHVDRDRVLCKQVFGIHVFRRANTSNLRWRVEQRVGHLAGDHVGFVGVGERDDNVSIIRAGAIEHLRMRGMTNYRADIEPVLQFTQHVRPHVDNSDLVGLFARQVIRS